MLGSGAPLRRTSRRPTLARLLSATICVLMTLGGMLASGGVAGARTWTSVDGTSREAELLGRKGGTVYLRSGGSTWSIPLAKLSPLDRQFVENNSGEAVSRIDREIVEVLDSVKVSLQTQKLAEAKRFLQEAADKAVNDRHRELVMDAQRVTNNFLLFHRAAVAAVEWLEPGAKVTLPRGNQDGPRGNQEKLPASVAHVVSRDEHHLQLRIGDKSYLFSNRELFDLPPPLLVALARRSLPPNAKGMACLNAYLRLAAPDADAERQLWLAAAERHRTASGLDVGPPKAPTIEEFTVEVAQFRKLLRADYERARLPEQRLELARSLFDLAAPQRKDDPTAYFVLIWESASMLSELGRLDAALSMVDALEQDYLIPQLARRRAALVATAAKVPRQDDELHRPILQACYDALEQALDANEFDAANDLLSGATATTNMVEDRMLKVKYRTQLTRWKTRVRRARSEFSEAAEAREALRQNPGDSVASGVLGRYLALRKQDWDTGLPLLAAGDDDGLVRAARADLAKPAAPASRVQVGSQWWELAERREYDSYRDAMEARAIHWYESAEGEVRGPDKLLVDLRIDKYRKRRTDVDAPGQVSLSSLRPGAHSGIYLRAGESLVRRNLRFGKAFADVAIWAQPLESDGSTRIGYKLDRKYLKLRGKIGYDDGYKSSVRVNAILFNPAGLDGRPGGAVVLPQQAQPAGTWSPVAFQIQNEKGKVLWGPTVLTTGQTAEFNIAVGSVDTLYLVTACQGSHLQAPAIWVDPVLVEK